MEEQYVIPKNVRSRFELIPGIGWKEVWIILLGVCIGAAFGGLIYLVSKQLVALVIVTLFCATIGFFVAKPHPTTGKNALDLLKDVRDFKSKPRRYYYQFGQGRK